MTTRERLPDRRPAETFDLVAGGLKYVCTVGRFADGRIGELFLGNHKSNSAADTSARDAAITFSIAVQHGADPETIRVRSVATATVAPAARSGWRSTSLWGARHDRPNHQPRAASGRAARRQGPHRRSIRCRQDFAAAHARPGDDVVRRRREWFACGRGRAGAACPATDLAGAARFVRADRGAEPFLPTTRTIFAGALRSVRRIPSRHRERRV